MCFIVVINRSKLEALGYFVKCVASMEYKKRRVLWSEFSRIVAQGLPSLITENFNYIMGAHEKIDGKQFIDSIDSREFISDLGLIDHSYIGSKFT